MSGEGFQPEGSFSSCTEHLRGGICGSGRTVEWGSFEKGSLRTTSADTKFKHGSGQTEASSGVNSLTDLSHRERKIYDAERSPTETIFDDCEGGHSEIESGNCKEGRHGETGDATVYYDMSVRHGGVMVNGEVVSNHPSAIMTGTVQYRHCRVAYGGMQINGQVPAEMLLEMMKSEVRLGYEGA